jgi:hypothetical protein
MAGIIADIRADDFRPLQMQTIQFKAKQRVAADEVRW